MNVLSCTAQGESDPDEAGEMQIPQEEDSLLPVDLYPPRVEWWLQQPQPQSRVYQEEPTPPNVYIVAEFNLACELILRYSLNEFTGGEFRDFP